MVYGIVELTITGKGPGKSLEVVLHLLRNHCVNQDDGLRP